TMDTAYVVCNENSGGSTVAVGSRLPNAWGLYDTAGNLWDRTRDTRDTGDLGGRRDAFSPGVGSGSQASRIRLRGGHWNLSSSHNYFRASHRDCTCSITDSGNEVGFRVAVIAE
ncbi:MAG: SUMF1/EgtB/PvdO family nonheme iron enzyme, partial [Kiritimatiellae bacterium]|nr:SUMF1/EgtB/PvdO family nonheme iron enzyme [Kiritimatiellia bacterium]